jgi:hypothetical protein
VTVTRNMGALKTKVSWWITSLLPVVSTPALDGWSRGPISAWACLFSPGDAMCKLEHAETFQEIIDYWRQPQARKRLFCVEVPPCTSGVKPAWIFIFWIRCTGYLSIMEVSRVVTSNYLLTPWCRTLFEKQIVTQIVKKYPDFFMEPEGSLPCTQKSATGPYPEPDESSLPLRSRSLKVNY